MQQKDLTSIFEKTIKERIFDGIYKIGESIPPLRELAKELSCSRSVINVGIARLASQGYLTIQKRQKTIVNDFYHSGSLDVISDMAFCKNNKLRLLATEAMLEARMLIEIGSVKITCKACNDNYLIELYEIIAEEEKILAENAGYKEIAVADYAFHRQLIKLSENIVYNTVMNSLDGIAQEMTQIFYKNNCRYFGDYIEAHKKIAAAIKNKQEETAAELLRNILIHGEEIYIKLE